MSEERDYAKQIGGAVMNLIPSGYDPNAIDPTPVRPLTPMETRRKRWETMCPAIYLDHKQELLPAAAKKHIKQLQAWDPLQGRGLVFVGPSRSGKTRMAWRVLRKFYINKGVSFVHHDMLSFPLLAARAFAGDTSIDKAVKDLSETPILYIDDALKQKLTEWQECFLLGILERRSRERRPLILTMNTTGKQLQERMTETGREDRFLPLVNRLMEFNDIIMFTE